MNIKVISASAGTGKTYTLAAEMLEDIASGAARPEAVVAITYTNKAAGELASRLRQRLLAAGHATEAAQVRDGYLGTVHSVCQRLLTELAFEAGTSPYPEPAPSGYAQELFAQAVSRVAGEQLSALASVLDALELDPSSRRAPPPGATPPATWRSLLLELVGLARANRLDASVLEASAERSIREVGDLLGAPLGEAAAFDARFESALRPIADQLAADREKQEAAGKKIPASQVKREDWVRTVQRRFEQGKLPSWSDLAAGVGVLTTKGLKEAGADWLDAWAAHLRHPRFQHGLAAIIEGLLGMAASAGQAFTEAKQAERLLEFDDMLAQAAALLKLPAAQDKLAGRIDLLMVDEFQDTSPVQLEVVMALAGLARRTVWVGDRKQGIFGFQGSDPALMLAATEAVLGGAEPHVLPRSYRSRPSLVQFCSEVFCRALAADGFSEAEVRIDAACPEPGALEGSPALHLWSTTKNPSSRKGVSEGAGLAKHLRRVLSAGTLQVREPVDDRTQPAPTRSATFGDVAILARTNKQCRAIAAALQAAGIPALVAQEGLGKTPEAQVLRAGLALAADPQDAMAAAELLRMLGDLSDPGPWLADRIAVLEADAKNGTAPAFSDNPRLQRLRAAVDRGRHWSPSEAVVEVLAALDLHRVVLGWPDPESHLANLEVLRAVAADYEQACVTRRHAATVSGLVRHLDTLPDTTEQALPTAPDAVRVLTYHKAKGLEWPVVVCAALQTVYGVKIHQPHMVGAETFDLSHPLQGRSVRWWPWPYASKKKAPELSEQTQASAVVQAREAALRAEHRRLLYVAFTRASDHLVLSRIDHKTGGTAWLDVLEDGEGNPVLDLPWDREGPAMVTLGDQTFGCAVATTSEVPDPVASQASVRPHWFAAVAAPTARLPQRVTPSSQTLPEAAQAGVRVLETLDLGPALPLRPKTGQMSSVGDALHGFFAVDRGSSDADRTALADRLRVHHGVEAVLSAAGMRTLSDRFSAWLDAHAPGVRLPEWPIRWLQDDGRSMAGDIDLLVPLEGGWLLLDHKSTTGDAAYRDHKLRSEWSGQLAAYRSAVEAATGLPVLELWVHLPVQGEVVQVEVPR